MNEPTQAIRLRITIDESGRWHGKRLHEAIVEEARKQGLAGASVFQGIMGFGSHSRVHSARLVDFSPDLPILIELVDEEARIQAFLETVHEMVQEGLVTVERVDVLLYRHRDAGT